MKDTNKTKKQLMKELDEANNRVAELEKSASERKHIENRLLESLQLLRLVLDTIPIRVFWKDKDLKYLGCNMQFAIDAGLRSTEEVINKSDLDMSWAEHAELYRTYDNTVIETGMPNLHYEQLETRSDGSVKWLRTSKMPLFDAEAEIKGILGIYEDISEHKLAEDLICRHRDQLEELVKERTAELLKRNKELEDEISERKRAEKALQEIEEKFKVHFQYSNDVMFTYDSSLKILNISPNVEKILGYKPSEFIGKSFYDLGVLGPADLYKAADDALEVLSGKPILSAVYQFIAKDGTSKFGEVSSIPLMQDDQVLEVISVARDITERKKSETILMESEDRLRRFFDVSSEGIIFHDHGKISDVNPACASIMGYDSAETMTGKSLFDFIAPEHHELAKGKMMTVCTEPFEIMLRRMDETIFPAEAISREYNFYGLKMRVVCFRDITERKHVEKSLRESEERFMMIADTITEVFWVTDVDTPEMSYVSPGYERVWGRPLASQYKNPRSFLEAIHEQDRERVLTDLEIQTAQKEAFDHEYRIVLPDGALRWIWDRGFPITDDTGKVIRYVGVAQDITERKLAEEEKRRLEMQLVLLQKMEALGRFAGGIAHDLNNILYPIIINTEVLLEETASDTSLYQTLRQTLNAAYRQRDLIKQILSFSRNSEQQLNPIKMAPLIKETLSFLRSSLPSTIEIQHTIDAPSDMILGDPTQIQQVIMNLCRNAVDAMESRTGAINVILTNTYLEPVPAHPEIKGGEFVQLTVKDKGCGIAPAVLDRIFEPFFTTKEAGKGSGMGLAVVHGILKNHHGAIMVESEAGKGSSFTVYLPLCDAKFRTPSPYAAMTSPMKGKGRILLVDDEEMVLTSLRNALQRSGYDVIALNNSMEALELFRRNPQEFDIVVTDLTMPQITGIELAKRFIALRPDIPIVLCTGFNDVLDELEAKAIGVRELLLKPAGTSELSSVIRRALEP
jgi:PAS domain S-box-containing protein